MSIFEMSINDFKNVKRRESWCSPVPDFEVFTEVKRI